MNLSKEMALILHRMMWSDMQKELGDNPSPDMRQQFKTDWIQRMFPDEYISNHCFLCEYAGIDGCIKCPIDWGNIPIGRWHARCCGYNTNYLTSPISEILALPEKDTERDYKSCVATDIAKGPSPDVMIMKELGQASGLPSWAPVNDHIEAIQKKAVEDYFKDNPGSKLVTMDVDAAFKQYAREQKAPILRKLAERSGLSASEPVDKHLDEIEKWASDCSAKAERDQIKKWLSAYSRIPAEKEVHEHVSAIIDNNYDKGMKDLLEKIRTIVEG